MIDLYINYQKHFTDNFTCVSVFSDNVRANITFDPENWAPAVWAGTEGLILEFMGNKLKVVKVHFEHCSLDCRIV